MQNENQTLLSLEGKVKEFIRIQELLACCTDKKYPAFQIFTDATGLISTVLYEFYVNFPNKITIMANFAAFEKKREKFLTIEGPDFGKRAICKKLSEVDELCEELYATMVA
jgi:uncharacterized protein YjaG (DUF416 family)